MTSHESRYSTPKKVARVVGWSLFALGLTTGTAAAVSYASTSSCAAAAATPDKCQDPQIDYGNKATVAAALGHSEDFGIGSAGVAAIGLAIVLFARRSGDEDGSGPRRESLPGESVVVVRLEDWQQRQQPPDVAAQGGDLAA